MITINTNYRTLEALRKFDKREAVNPHYSRIAAELRYLSALSLSHDGGYDRLIAGAAEALAADIAERGRATAEAVERTEKALASFGAEAKSYQFLCMAHAHIDMNWQWGYDETVAVTLATMGTMLDMMDEYPAFTFSQSQATVYRMVEQFAPRMLERIKNRIREGRWEVLASTWVETDKNLPNGESLSRHILYTKKYFSETFGIAPGDLVIDFEPDTFGHSRNVPEICASGGVRYYYHCRGQIGEQVAYRWRAPSGAELLLYTEPFWYNSGIDCSIAEYAPELSRLTSGKTLLKLYGVGDHGGGPTRRDINRIIEMDSWPLYPKFRFGRLGDYFAFLEQSREGLPVLDEEINFICDGCYTTQGRIKAGNRKAERLMADAEFYAGAAALVADEPYPGENLAGAWRKILFNQFHDIIPGSGVTETREYAMARYQDVFAAAESARTLALDTIAGRIRRAGIDSPEEGLDDSLAQGAGVGSGQTGRGAGKRRFYHVFNSLPYDREETVPIKVWEYEGDIAHGVIEDWTGRRLPVQKGESGRYWGHHFDTLITRLSVPSCGYTTVILDEKPDYTPRTGFTNDQRIQRPDVFSLENDFLRVVLNPQDGSIASFFDKETGTELAPKGGFGVFRLAIESRYNGISDWRGHMSAWFTGRFKSLENLTRNVELRPHAGGPVRTAWSMALPFGSGSSLEAIISLDSGSRLLRYEVNCDWREFGSEGGIPNLNFHLPLGWKPAYLFDLPFGMKERASEDMDLPAESFVMAKNPGGGPSLALFSLDKYAFRCLEDNLSLTLIRGADRPDPTPETGRHRISFALSPVAPAAGREDLAAQSLAYRRPLHTVSGRNRTAATGVLEPSGSFFRLKGGVLSAVKAPEGAFSPKEPGEKAVKALLFRVYEIRGRETEAELSLPFPAVSAFLTDAAEEKRLEGCTLSGDKKTLHFTLPPFGVRAIVAEWQLPFSSPPRS
jgi:alpha-mannosidase